jgi:hypothetical protein
LGAAQDRDVARLRSTRDTTAVADAHLLVGQELRDQRRERLVLRGPVVAVNAPPLDEDAERAVVGSSTTCPSRMPRTSSAMGSSMSPPSTSTV